MTNHPVHILDQAGHISPSALIPFCQFGGDMAAMGQQTDLFKIPVCASFQPRILYDQLCYQVDVEELYPRHKMTASNLKLGLSLMLDTNYNRQHSLQGNRGKAASLDDDLVKKYVNLDDDDEIKIYIGAIGQRRKQNIVHHSFHFQT